MEKFKVGDIARLSKVFFNGTMMYPSGIHFENFSVRHSGYKFLHNFKENEVGIIKSGPYRYFDSKMWELFINNDSWLVDDIHMNLLDENE